MVSLRATSASTATASNNPTKISATPVMSCPANAPSPTHRWARQRSTPLGHVLDHAASSIYKVRFQRLAFPELAYAHHAEADDVTLRVHAFHDGVVLGFLLITGGVGETDFKEIR